MKNCRPLATPVMRQDCGTEVNAASAAAKAIDCSSTEAKRRCGKKNRGGNAIVRCDSRVGVPFAEIPHTEKPPKQTTAGLTRLNVDCMRASF